MDINASEYFLAQCPDSGLERPMYRRIANALSRCDDITMEQLCKMSEKELGKVRSIGDKARAIVIVECHNYLKEKMSAEADKEYNNEK